MITTPLRIILVEDEETDAVLIKRRITKIVETVEVKVVKDLPGFENLFTNFLPDVVISDYNLPSGTGLDIMELVKSIDESIPLIFITGALDDDELAANTILSGASGFILKKHMSNLHEKLEPLLKQVVYNMVQHEELREQIRKNKIAVHQIYSHLDSMKADDIEQRENIKKIRNNLDKFNIEDAE
ncbi:CheY chemotaxis protein or a CheY-like REC (receiver) domain [Salegentibacter holothuriorum]|uniref:CheY chemotaxis protein or a CheY-like REC (Receiver) domain n=1 Tax=Salegentibacter holothuriorum TaxID=241145 RepID=A0A1T5AMP9_9FLAO|nr:response regulator [Salegentibacter holothuriorum]SKB36109.1 CheY chemotaxis protein or a CheY-like REC (receiver) domain [Salegentibacter holothuriorum]